MFFDHERRPERNHEEDPEQPTRGSEQKNVPVIELEAEKDQSRQGEGYAGRNRFASRAHRLHHVVFEDS